MDGRSAGGALSLNQSLHILSPAALGLSPARYPQWRDVQVEALNWLMSHRGDARVKGLCLPTGSGKSPLAAAYAALTGQRTAILVGTRQLQDQYGRDLGAGYDPQVAVWADLRGQSNYTCAREGRPVTVEMAPCQQGQQCEMGREDGPGGCLYYGSDGALARAGEADVVVLNYSAWLHLVNGPRRLREFSCLILDEGDTALDWLSEYLAAQLWERGLLSELPAEGTDMQGLQLWAVETDASVAALLKAVPLHHYRERLEWQRVRRELSKVVTAQGSWVASWEGRKGTSGRVLRVEPVEPAAYVGRALLQDVGDVVVMSATLTKGYMEMFTRYL